jgi:hypothetical protein
MSGIFAPHNKTARPFGSLNQRAYNSGSLGDDPSVVSSVTQPDGSVVQTMSDGSVITTIPEITITPGPAPLPSPSPSPSPTPARVVTPVAPAAKTSSASMLMTGGIVLGVVGVGYYVAKKKGLV